MASSVSFAASADASVDSSGIVVRDLGQNTYAINLGFLKHNHKYQISFFVANRLADYDLTYDPLQSLHFRIGAIERRRDEDPATSGHQFNATLTAAKEKLMREKVTLKAVGAGDSAGGGELRLEINARVLGKDKGTPALKAGVKSVGVDRDLEDDSEQSDWQGFG